MNQQVVIVDDRPLIRLTVRLLLEKEGYDIVGEAENRDQAMKLTQPLAPGTVILDLGLPKVDDLTVLKCLTALCLPVKTIVLTANLSNRLAFHGMPANARGFIDKYKLCQLVNSTQAKANGDDHIPDRSFCLTRHQDDNSHDAELLKTLSACELGILQQLAQGLSNKQIAERMLLSSRTISAHKTRISLKLKTSSLLNLCGLKKRNTSTRH